MMMAMYTKRPGALITEEYPMYHTSDEIHEELAKLSLSHSNSWRMEWLEEDDADSETAAKALQQPKCSAKMALVRTDVGSDWQVEANSSLPHRKKRVMIIFGEHSREAISPETSLRFAQMIAGVNTDNATKAHVDRLLSQVDFAILPIVNV